MGLIILVKRELHYCVIPHQMFTKRRYIWHHVNVILSVITNSPTKLRSFFIHIGSAFGASYKRRHFSDKDNVGMLYIC